MSGDYLRAGKFALPVDRGAVAREWAGRGYTCDLFVDPPGRAWIDFVHASNELVTVMEGELELTVAGESLLVGPGDEVLVPRRARHSVRNVHRGTTRWLYGYD